MNLSFKSHDFFICFHLLIEKVTPKKRKISKQTNSFPDVPKWPSNQVKPHQLLDICTEIMNKMVSIFLTFTIVSYFYLFLTQCSLKKL